ncbi:MAG: bifunctional ADP-heptose synthase [Blastocatellia bacterium]|nr:bifunctional ADP-heptose synthase [Blastocatellia bacterium]
MGTKPSAARLLDVIARFRGRRIVVVGDLIADEFIYGEISRISREAPVMILRFEHKETQPGGGGNAAANLAALGADVSVVSLVGRDIEGRSVVRALRQRGVDVSAVSLVPQYRTPTKTRILAGSVHSTRQQVIRIDREPESSPPEAVLRALVPRVRELAASADGVILSDYHYGLVHPLLVEAIRRLARQGLLVTVDSRHRLRELGGFTSATPNQSEVEEIYGRHLDDLSALERAGRQLRRRLQLQALLITRGKEGMSLFQDGRPVVHLPVVGSREPVDVTGAGDTVIATYTLALAAGASFLEAAHLANHAGGIVVMKRGTATVSEAELRASILSWESRDERGQDSFSR